MASGQTTNFGLNQWAAEDKVLRTDFNADNAKLDAALAGMPRVITGSYTGTGSTETASYDIGARPKLLILATNNAVSSGGCIYYMFAWENANLFVGRTASYAWLDSNAAVTFTDTGFTIRHGRWSSDDGLNTLGKTHRYWALC